jgi:hypothetical protein
MSLQAATRCCLCAVFALALGCGSSNEETGSGAPKPIAGGGVNGAALAGKLDLFVIDSASGAPIADAEVFVGEGMTARAAGVTDRDGHLALSDSTLSGPQSIAARASGYASAAWLGVARSEVTLPLRPLTTSADKVSVTATIAGWDTMPAPAAGKIRVARLSAAYPISLGALDAAANSAPSLTDTCIADASGSSCTLSLEAPRSAKQLLAEVAEGDGSALNATGLALLDVDLETQSEGLTLELAAAEATTAATVTPGTAPSALFVIGVPGVSADQQVLVFPAFSPPLVTHLIPVGQASASLWAMGIAHYADGASIALQRGLPLPDAASSEPVDLAPPAFLELPDASPAAAGGFGLVRAADAELCALSFSGADGSLDVLVLDDRMRADPPSALMPSVAVELGIAITDANVDVQSFAWADVVAKTTRRAFRRRSPP